jgi:excisionase family DNA binding protein
LGFYRFAVGISTVYENRIALSVKEAAEATSYNESRLRQFIANGVLKAYRPGGIGDYRIFREDLDAWIRGDGRVLVRRRGRPSLNKTKTAAA